MSASANFAPTHWAPLLVLRARAVLPMAQPPIKDGAVLVHGSEIAAVGRWKDLRAAGPAADLGDVLLLPGLINAHCHLDYTDMAGHISPPRSFSDWIKAMLALKAHWTYSDYAASWLHGARMLLRHGVTTVADIEAVPELLPDVLTATPIRVCSFLELTGVRSRRPPADILAEATCVIDSVGCWAGLSPHAPYSTSPELLRLCGDMARRRGWRIVTHVAESREELEMFTGARGPMFDWLQPQRDMADCGHGSPVQHLHRAGVLGPDCLAVHANYVDANDIAILAKTGTSVVHCPRSHEYFGHRTFPRAKLAAAGVNICLGSDSLASVKGRGRTTLQLDLWDEMRALADADAGLAPETILRWATVNGARALGQTGQLGELSPGARADVIALPAPQRMNNLWETALEHRGPVRSVMINGRWITAHV